MYYIHIEHQQGINVYIYFVNVEALVALHRQIYITARDDCTTVIARKKTQHYRGQLQNANNKNIFSILR